MLFSWHTIQIGDMGIHKPSWNIETSLLLKRKFAVSAWVKHLKNWWQSDFHFTGRHSCIHQGSVHKLSTPADGRLKIVKLLRTGWQSLLVVWSPKVGETSFAAVIFGGEFSCWLLGKSEGKLKYRIKIWMASCHVGPEMMLLLLVNWGYLNQFDELLALGH